MFNIDKTRNLIKQRGLKIGKVCEMLGYKDTFLADVARGKQSISEENVYKVAQILGTSFEYLMDMTDDPDPNFLVKLTESTEERIVHEVMGKLADMPEDQKETLSRLLKLPDEEFRRAMDMFNIMWGK